ncbi:unnamed protein product [Paramecium pentaurelia]|uniref:Uncharacterized protein n=1 Tax=Paramecium pentaurelia TaxID=43138 RepID=A0A8S1SFK3_9CILI|nr:unnamed protein product [Paramecium pentaurelia]
MQRSVNIQKQWQHFIHKVMWKGSIDPKALFASKNETYIQKQSNSKSKRLFLFQIKIWVLVRKVLFVP